jgi:hypothetical protein
VSNKFSGLAKVVTSRAVGNRGTAYNVKLDDEALGEVWVGLGFEKPPFNKGDLIEFEAEKNDAGYWQMVRGTGRLKPPPKAEREPAPSAQQQQNTNKEAFRGGYNDPAKQMSIVLQHSQEMAVRAVTVLLANEALPLTKGASKANEAQRFDQVLGYVDKLTVKFYHDATTDRLLTSVADMGVVNTAPDAPLPDSKEGAKSGRKRQAKTEEDDLGGEPPNWEGE